MKRIFSSNITIRNSSIRTSSLQTASHQAPAVVVSSQPSTEQESLTSQPQMPQQRYQHHLATALVLILGAFPKIYSTIVML